MSDNRMSRTAWLRHVLIMELLVMPAGVLIIALAFSLDPQETAPFVDLLDAALVQIVLGPSAFGILMIPLHYWLSRQIQLRWRLHYRTASVVAGALLGFMIGGLWSTALPWSTLGVGFIGMAMGVIYGVLVSPLVRFSAAGVPEGF